jgi:ribosome maturation factor RimP
MDLIKQIEEIVKPVIEKEGYEFKKVEVKQRGRAKELIITIDKGGKLSVEDCAKVSRMVDPIIEKADLIKGKYFLIVSSSGIE